MFFAQGIVQYYASSSSPQSQTPGSAESTIENRMVFSVYRALSLCTLDAGKVVVDDCDEEVSAADCTTANMRSAALCVYLAVVCYVFRAHHSR